MTTSFFQRLCKNLAVCQSMLSVKSLSYLDETYPVSVLIEQILINIIRFMYTLVACQVIEMTYQQVVLINVTFRNVFLLRTNHYQYYVCTCHIHFYMCVHVTNKSICVYMSRISLYVCTCHIPVYMCVHVSYQSICVNMPHISLLCVYMSHISIYVCTCHI